jgi:hypothetical protein
VRNHSRGDRRGEEKLMVAVVEDAIKCVQRCMSIGKKGFSKSGRLDSEEK